MKTKFDIKRLRYAKKNIVFLKYHATTMLKTTSKMYKSSKKKFSKLFAVKLFINLYINQKIGISFE